MVMMVMLLRIVMLVMMVVMVFMIVMLVTEVRSCHGETTHEGWHLPVGLCFAPKMWI